MTIEYGGFSTLDIYENKEYYSGKNVVALNCARYGIVYAILDAAYTKIYIPFYMCPTVKQTLEMFKINYEEYHINEEFEPINVTLKEHECILLFNFCGVILRNKIIDLVDKYKNVIIDNSQAFFLEPILEVYNIYSCRKFIGVTDGCYVIKKGIAHKDKKYEEDYSSNRVHILFSALEYGNNYSYEEYLQIENGFAGAGIKRMSLVTHSILGQTNYEYIIDRRRANYNVINNLFKCNKDIATIATAENTVPMKYPLLVKNSKNIRERLIEKKIYIPFWWNGISEVNSFENRLMCELLVLPIDQRYSALDMERMVEIIKTELFA
ncbi:hypothetical protein FMM75_17760 [Lachnospiraceae bacterium MD335]|nr:hypothetical protein [Lachnospiraceae bacterium MD335]